MPPHPPTQPHGVYDTTLCVEELRDALAAHGITLPSLRVDLPGSAGTYRPPAGLVALGNCNTATARRLLAVLRGRGVLDLDLLAAPEAVPGLRRAVRRHLGEPCADVQLCVTELVANVIRHVGEGVPVRVRVARVDGGRIRVEVTDPDARALPVLLHATGDDEAGRGLALLDAVAVRWGVEQGVAGKTVWCELAEAE
ncbi:ATP-binding protein [Streptomyces fulvoviolaceus]|uniref:ATP-binding protein n=1 Tax=Streptomyces fulvoviolaceus TaxID=285535 RepID=UPI0021BF7FD3|nr:ATP-binding protein [Streptomyces fulvoviolaceus]MCT9082113.1 ATP-binding protein [Streptomyces fulvoviolaceus]